MPTSSVNKLKLYKNGWSGVTIWSTHLFGRNMMTLTRFVHALILKASHVKLTSGHFPYQLVRCWGEAEPQTVLIEVGKASNTNDNSKSQRLPGQWYSFKKKYLRHRKFNTVLKSSVGNETYLLFGVKVTVMC